MSKFNLITTVQDDAVFLLVNSSTFRESKFKVFATGYNYLEKIFKTNTHSYIIRLLKKNQTLKEMLCILNLQQNFIETICAEYFNYEARSVIRIQKYAIKDELYSNCLGISIKIE